MTERPIFNWLEKKLMKLKPIRRLILEGFKEGVRMTEEVKEIKKEDILEMMKDRR